MMNINLGRKHDIITFDLIASYRCVCVDFFFIGGEFQENQQNIGV